MAIGATHRTTAADSTDATSFATASFASTAGRLIIGFVASWKALGGNNTVPTLSSVHGTWSQVNSASYNRGRISCFLCVADGDSGAVTIDFGATTQDSCAWSFTEYDTADSIVQSAISVGAGTTPLATLGAFENALNATIGGMSAIPDPTVGAGFTQLGETNSTDFYINTQWNAGNDTTVDWTISSNDWQVIAIELREASVAGPSGFLEFM